MQIKVRRNLGRGYPPYTEGQVVAVSDKEGKRLCDEGLADPVIAAIPQRPVRAVPPRPERKPAEKPESTTDKKES